MQFSKSKQRSHLLLVLRGKESSSKPITIAKLIKYVIYHSLDWTHDYLQWSMLERFKLTAYNLSPSGLICERHRNTMQPISEGLLKIGVYEIEQTVPRGECHFLM